MMTAKEDLYNWVVDNSVTRRQRTRFSETVKSLALENGWDMIDADLMVDELVENVRKGY